MVNRHRGEIEAVLDGRPYRLVLTLGALAELEAAFGDEDMLALAGRFEKGRLSARDCVRIIGAGLRGAGLEIDDGAVAAMRSEGGAAAYVSIVGRLLNATFGDGEARPTSAAHSAVTTEVASGKRSDGSTARGSAPAEAGARGPFPGPT